MSDYKPVYENSFALVIGIDSYSDPRFPTLGNAASDAQSLGELLAGPPFNFSVTTLLNEQATRQGILSALFGLRTTGQDDRIIVYFAGHGYTLVDKFNNETGYLAASDTIPEQDFTALELNEVTDLRLHAGAKHISFVFDACFSGQALGLTRAASTASDKFLIRRAYQVISAGAGDQTVSDVRSMTTRVVEALKGALIATDGMITFSALGAYVRDAIAADSGQTQLPQFGHLRGSQGGDFVMYQESGTRLPSDLLEALYSKTENIRLGAVVDLIDLAHGADDDLAVIARERLDKIRTDDPSQEIRHAAAAFFLRESRAGHKTGAQHRVELVVQRRKPQELVNALDALVPDTMDGAPVPDKVKKAVADLEAVEAAKAADAEAEAQPAGKKGKSRGVKAEAAAPAAQPASPIDSKATPTLPRTSLPAAAPAQPKPAAKPAPGQGGGGLLDTLRKVPVGAWGAIGVVVIAFVAVMIATGGNRTQQPEVAAGNTDTPEATQTEVVTDAPPTDAAATDAVAGDATATATTAPTDTPAPTDTVPAGEAVPTQFGGGRGRILFSGERGSDIDIYAMSGAGGGVLDLTNSPGITESQPAWSPDGEQFAFVSSQDGNKDIYSLTSDGSDLVNLTNSSADDYAPVYSHSGTQIAFVSERLGNADIMVMDVATLNVTNLTESSFQDDHPTWSPDDSRIAFVSQRGGNKDIYFMRSNGRGLINLTNNSADDIDPAWSPEGSYIAFSSFRTGNWEIYLADLQGNVYQITYDPADDLNPVWSPDSTRLVFVSNRNNDRQLWVMDLIGGNLTQITDGFRTALDPTWLD